MNPTIVISGCTKNSGSYIYETLEILTRFGNIFDAFKLLVYENDSTDNTVCMLELFRPMPILNIPMRMV